MKIKWNQKKTVLEQSHTHSFAHGPQWLYFRGWFLKVWQKLHDPHSLRYWVPAVSLLMLAHRHFLSILWRLRLGCKLLDHIKYCSSRETAVINMFKTAALVLPPDAIPKTLHFYSESCACSQEACVEAWKLDENIPNTGREREEGPWGRKQHIPHLPDSQLLVWVITWLKQWSTSYTENGTRCAQCTSTSVKALLWLVLGLVLNLELIAQTQVFTNAYQ